VRNKGLALASLSILVAIVGWIVLWKIGVIAAVVPFVSAWLAVWLYQKGSGSRDLKPVAVPLLIIIVVGVLLAFLSGMMLDAWAAYTEFEQNAVFGADFFNFFFVVLSSGEVWQGYIQDILFTLLFAALGAGGIIKSLFVPEMETPTGTNDISPQK
jgi:hypothetical protein